MSRNSTSTVEETLDKLSAILTEYECLTDMLVAVEPLEADKFNLIIENREKVLTSAKSLQEELFNAIEQHPDADKTIIRKMLCEQSVTTSVSPQLKPVQEKIIALLSQQHSILSKDENVRMRCSVRFDEAKDKLEELKKKKNRINFYESTKVNGLGRKLDSNS